MNSYLIEVSQNPNYTPTKGEIDELKNEVLCFTMASHLLWTLWAFVNVHQDIEFEYWVNIDLEFKIQMNSTLMFIVCLL